MHILINRMNLSSLVRALVDQHGWPLDEVCEVAGLPVAQFIASVEASPIKNYMPRLSEIQSRAAAIRSGDVVMNQASFKHWEKYRNDQHAIGMDEQQQRDAFDLAGTIEDDAAMVRGWLRE